MFKKLHFLSGIIMLTIMSYSVKAETYEVSFESTNPDIPVDSIVVTNNNTSESVTLAAGDVLNLVSTVNVHEKLMFKGKIDVYPNPMQQATQLLFNAKSNGTAVLGVYELSGREILTVQRNLNEGVNVFELSDVGEGLYFVCVQGSNYRYTAKVISNMASSKAANLTFVGNRGIEASNTYKSAYASIALDFTEGDEINYVAYSSVCDPTEVTEATMESKTISFEFTGCSAAVATSDASEIGFSKATSGGTITMFGDVTIDACGVQWGLSDNTEEWNNADKTSDTINNDAFVSSIENLEANTTYYLQSYIKIAEQTIYGDIKSFTTLESPINASIISVDSVGYTMAAFTAEVSISDTSNIDSVGFVYGAENNPTIDNCIEVLLCDTVDGKITVTLSDLELDSTYFVRAFIIDSNLTMYSSTSEIKTLAPSAPVLTSSAPDSVYQTTMKCYGKLIDDGGLRTYRGFLLSLDSVVSFNVHTWIENEGTGVGDFSTKVEALISDTVYLVKAFAYNTIDTVYGAVDTVRTMAYSEPMIELLDTIEIYQKTAKAFGNIMSNGGKDISRYGFILSEDGIPTIDDYDKREYTYGDHTGQFTEEFTRLTPETKYYIRAYAKNDIGVGYSELDSITTLPIAAPVISIDSISNVTAQSATCNVYLASDGGATIGEKGIVWSTTATPDMPNNEGIAKSKSYNSKFEIELTDLAPLTKYYVRSYAINSVDTAYSALDSVTTSEATMGEIEVELASFASDSAILSCNVISTGGAEITSKGIIWSATANPTLEANDGAVADTNNNAEFDCIMNGLTENTVYYVRAYVTNSKGTAYTDSIMFNSGYAIGKSMEGGKVGYVFQPGDNGYVAGECHGIIVAISDYMNKAVWGEKFQVPAAQQSAIGKGWENTQAIVDAFGSSGQNAAYLCTQRSSGGFTDWFLPSSGEMERINKNKDIIGGFKDTDHANNMYWTSTDVRKDEAYTYSFEYGMSMTTHKDVEFWFRPARYF